MRTRGKRLEDVLTDALQRSATHLGAHVEFTAPPLSMGSSMTYTYMPPTSLELTCGDTMYGAARRSLALQGVSGHFSHSLATMWPSCQD